MMTDNKPIFIFSSSWRSGSTLLQRWLTASKQVLVWGENGGALNDFHQAYMGFAQMMGDPRLRYKDGWGAEGAAVLEEFRNTPIADRPHLWMANLCPRIDHVRATFASGLRQIYERPTLELGYQRFGIKETRCDLSTARFLRDLFPDAKFVFLVRDPLAVLLSIKRRNWVIPKTGFAALRYHVKHWQARSTAFRQADFGMKLRYEDFISDQASRDRLLEYLEIDSPPPTDFLASSHADWAVHGAVDLNLWERWWARNQLREEMDAWGYR